MANGKKKKDKPEDEKNILEWVVFFISLCLVLGLVGYLTYQSFTYENHPPDLLVEFKADPSPHAPYRYHITVKNSGHETATEVQMEMIIEKNGKLVESSTLNIPFVPQQSLREGWVNFSIEPTKADSIYGRIISYKRQ